MTTDKRYRVGVVGGGAVGLTYAALLAESELVDVVVKTRGQKQASSLKSHGIHLTIGDEQETIVITDASADARVLADCDGIIITAKSYDTAAIADEISEHLKPDAIVLTLQNGLEAFDILRSRLKHPERVVDGVTIIGASRTDDRSVFQKGSFRTIVDKNTGKLAEVLKRTRFSTETSDNIQQAVWDKMVLNTGQNALSAVTNLTLGEMLKSKHCLDIASKLLDELQQVAGAEGVQFKYSLMDKLKDNWKMSTFRPSMWQDIHKGNKTEIDAINGAISRLGKKHDLDTPYNDMMTSLIKTIEP